MDKFIEKWRKFFENKVVYVEVSTRNYVNQNYEYCEKVGNVVILSRNDVEPCRNGVDGTLSAAKTPYMGEW